MSRIGPAPRATSPPPGNRTRTAPAIAGTPADADATIAAPSRSETVSDADVADTIEARGGNDRVRALRGNDVVVGNVRTLSGDTAFAGLRTSTEDTFDNRR